MARRRTPDKRKHPDEKIKATQAQMLLRINHVYKMTVMGANRPDILQYGIETWGVTESTIDTYIARAREELQKQVEPEREELRKIAAERLNTIFAKSMKVMDYQRAIAAQREINQIFGLYAPVKSESKVSGTITVDERRQRISELLDTARIRGTGNAASGGTRLTDD